MEKLANYYHHKQQGTSKYLTLIVASNATNISFLDYKILMHGGNIIILRENIEYTIEKPVCDIFDYEEVFFDNIFYSQLSDCKIIYDFLNIKNPKNEHLYFNYKKNSLAFRSIGQIKDNFLIDDIHSDKMLRLSLISTLTQIFREYQTNIDISKSSMNRQHQFGKILGYIGNNYATTNLNDVAKKFNYNPDYLSTYFKKVTNQTFTEKLMEIKIEQAKRYLLTTDLKIEEIIHKVGFKDKSFFMRKFKENTGYTPLKYRKQYTKN